LKASKSLTNTFNDLTVKCELEPIICRDFMKVLAFVGSPRKASNTDLVVSAILQGTTENKNISQKVYLYDSDIKPCIDCQACKKGNFECALKDSMQQLYPSIEEAKVLIFGSPLYWYCASAKMKLLVDRLRPYIASKKLKGKKAILVIPSEEGPYACNYTVGMFKESFKYLGINLVATLLPKASERAEVKKQPQTLEAALEIGKNL
jgi:multimeric flavodoxin WrbA